MYDVPLAVDAEEERALAQAEAVDDLPGAADVRATPLYGFEENPEAASRHTGRDRPPRPRVPGSDRRRRGRARGGQRRPRRGHRRPPDPRRRAQADADREVLFGSVTRAVVPSTDRSVLVCGEGDE